LLLCWPLLPLPLPGVVSVAAGVSVGAVAVALPSVGSVGSVLGADWFVGCSGGAVVGVAAALVGLVGFDARDVPVLRCGAWVVFAGADLACAGFFGPAARVWDERPPAWLLADDDELAGWLSPLRRCVLAFAFEPAGVFVLRT
jgi:hypothetical protein